MLFLGENLGKKDTTNLRVSTVNVKQKKQKTCDDKWINTSLEKVLALPRLAKLKFSTF